MVISIRNAVLEIYTASTDDDYASVPDLMITSDPAVESQYAGDLYGISIKERIQDAQDKATFSLRNTDGQYTDLITPGDRVVFRASDDRTQTGEFGFGPFGESAYSGAPGRWWGKVDPGRKLEKTGAGQHLISFESEDFVFSTLADREVYAAFENRQISGTYESVVNRLVRERAPEIGLDYVDPIEVDTSIERSGENLLDVLITMARRADATMWSRLGDLVFTKIDGLEPVFELTEDDYRGFEKSETTTEMINDIRIDGATDMEEDEPAIQDIVETYRRVSGDNRITWQINTSSNRLAAMEIWTRRDPNSEDNLVVRIHPDRNGAPANLARSGLDIYRRNLTHDFISDDDWTTFLFAEDVMSSTSPWLVIESEGDIGHEVGARLSDNAPAYKGYYPYTIAVREENRESVEEYRRRQGHVKDTTITSYTEARDVAQEYLSHDSLPKGKITFEAHSIRAHSLEIGNVITVDEPYENAVGDYLITEVDTNYQDNKLKSTITATDVNSF